MLVSNPSDVILALEQSNITKTLEPVGGDEKRKIAHPPNAVYMLSNSFGIPGIEPGILVPKANALPLGHIPIGSNSFELLLLRLSSVRFAH